MEYKHQSKGGFGVAYPVQFSPESKEKEKEEEFQSLEEALTGETKNEKSSD